MSNDFGEIMQSAIEDHLAGMSSEDFGALVARVRPPTDPASVRASLGQKAAAMWETPRGPDGPTAAGSFAAAAAARAPQQAPPAPEPPTSQGFTANRGQDRSGSGTPPEPPRALRPLR